MGNCCKKKQEKVSGSIESSSTEKGIDKTGNDKKIDTKKKGIDVLKLKDNLDSREFLNKDKNRSKSNISNNSSKELTKNEKKKLDEYKKIVEKYIEFRKKLETKSKENIYIVQEDDTIELIKLYNSINQQINNENDLGQLIINELTEFIINREEIKKEFKSIDFNQCEKILNDEFGNKKIDLLSKDLCQLLKVSGEKATYYNEHKKNNFRYLQFENNKKIKININSGIFHLVEIIEESIDSQTDNNDISLEISKKVKNKNKSKPKNEEKKEEIIEVKSDIEKKVKINLIDFNEEEAKSENKKEEIKENKISTIQKAEKVEMENNINDILFKILFLYSAQNNEFKKGEKYYICNKNIINYIFEQIETNNKDINDINELIINFLWNEDYINFDDIFNNIHNILKKFRQENLNLFENNYNFNIIDKKNFILEQKEIEYNNKDIKKIPSDFILIKQEIYELLIKLFNLEQKEYIDEIFYKSDLLKDNNENISLNINESNTIYICKIEKINKIEFYNIFFVLSYNSTEIYLKEIILFEKNNFDLNLYLQEKKTNINKYFQKMYDENNIDIGYFINLNQQNIEEQKEEELIQESKGEKKKEEKKKEEIEEEKKEEKEKKEEEEIKEEQKKEQKEEIKEELIEEPKEEQKEEKKEEIKDELIVETKEEMKEEQKEEQKDELIDETKEEKKDELIEKTKEDIKEEQKEVIEQEKKEEIKEEEKIDELIDEAKEEIKEKKNVEIKLETKREANEEEEEKKDEINLKPKEEQKEDEKINKENKDINEEKEIPLERIGLSNINSNSYLNSVLHCIYNIQELTNFFISDKNFLNLTEESFTNDDKIILNNIEITKDSLSFKYLEIIFYLYHKKQNNKYIKNYSPRNILEYIQTQEPDIFHKNIERNPKEFLSYLIKKLKEELKEEENIKNLENEEDFILMNSLVGNEEILYKKYLNNFLFKNNSIIDKLLAGIEFSSFTCDKCKEQENNFQHFYNIEFPLTKIEKNLINLNITFEKISLEECFKYYFKNHITSQNCKKCNNNINNIISQKIFLSPKILIISIGNIREKRDLFKLDEEINLNEYIKENNEGYKLIGIIVLYNQTGSSERYYAYCYNNEEKKWYCFVDDYIYEINDDLENEIKRANRLPYILFYKDKNLFN